ncbi:hypothetical protein K7X08_003812 [Anisodus acutangulus]|uniref:BAG domain-containing protein n=1 Tax=Anisodus acutangulus TaxID=402998 RepID=A0A9Q1RJI1_9SOLA|nr:hypothetical protein K7X08_003812 [Anisodus acutangulus]
MSIRKEVEDIERKVLCRKKGELIRSDEKERLRVNETLMSLLFKLDSIRGVDSGVRELRKAVIRKAVFLQEKIDSIVFAAANQIATEEENQYNDSDELSEPVNQDEYGKSTIQSVDVQNQAASNDEKTPVEGELQDCPMEGSEERGEVVGDVIDENERRRSQRLDGEDESRRNRELLEKMVEKNEKMMRMMNELCQTNEIQMRMLNSLTQRVDQLEKAFVCDRKLQEVLMWDKEKNRCICSSTIAEMKLAPMAARNQLVIQFSFKIAFSSSKSIRIDGISLICENTSSNTPSNFTKSDNPRLCPELHILENPSSVFGISRAQV